MEIGGKVAELSLCVGEKLDCIHIVAFTRFGPKVAHCTLLRQSLFSREEGHCSGRESLKARAEDDFDSCLVVSKHVSGTSSLRSRVWSIISSETYFVSSGLSLGLRI